MSAEVAPQGIAQDYVTLLIAVPLLLVAYDRAGPGKLSSRLLLAGTLAYFLVTYVFYLMMATYNELFLLYVVLAGCSFFAFAIVYKGIGTEQAVAGFATVPARRLRAAGWFLIVNAALIALLWLSIVVPPLLSGEIIPRQVEHYTTLVVQGFDLSILLPLSFVAGWLVLRGKPEGNVLTPIYLVFLSLLMIALVAKLIGMGLLGYAIVPAIFIIPVLASASIYLAARILAAVS